MSSSVVYISAPAELFPSPCNNGQLQPWASELALMINKGLEIHGCRRRLKVAGLDYHQIASGLLRLGLSELGDDCECTQAAAAIAAQHAIGEDWGVRVNDAWMAAHRAGPFNARQWIARAAAKSAHRWNEGSPRDLAITAAWVVRLHADRRNAWQRIADIVEGVSADATNGADVPCEALSPPSASKFTSPTVLSDEAKRWHQGLALVMRRYGLLALDVDAGTGSVIRSLAVINANFDDITICGDQCTIVFLGRAEHASLIGLEGQREVPGQLLVEAKRSWFRKRRPVYHPLLDFVSFQGEGLTPLVQTLSGRVVVGWHAHEGRRILVVGLDVVEELVRYTQGNPGRVTYTENRNLWGAGHEQATYLYDGHVVPRHELEPWADKIGYFLAETIAAEADIPLISPLPYGARGGIILTGDDDQAWLEKYEEQLAILGDFPITYCMLPHTNHTPETLAMLPESVEFGVHVDALERPSDYAAICAQQTAEVRKLLGGRPAHTIRNHGHLNNGYWGHLPAWEAAGLTFGLNIRGLDGTCPTGSYLPFRVRRPDGAWSSHTSLFSTFSDSMYFLQKWTEKQQIKVIRGLAAQIEATSPGLLVFNFHPQNVGQLSGVHRAVIAIGRRPGWKAFGAESFRQWLDAVDRLRMSECGGGVVLSSQVTIHKLAVRWPRASISGVLPPWQGSLKLMADV